MPFRNTNRVFGLNGNAPFQVGISDADTGLAPEIGIQLPSSTSDDASWVYFECQVEVLLDSGIVVHNTLPQFTGNLGILRNKGAAAAGPLPAPAQVGYDSLASSSLDDLDLDSATGGINLSSIDQYTDIIQRMGHSRYWFHMWGRAIRIGQQVPIPGIRFIGGVPAIPYDKNPQWAHNSIVPGGNFNGTILWKAEWSQWYTTVVPPINNDIPAADPAAHISSVAPTPDNIQAPWSQPDDNAIPG